MAGTVLRVSLLALVVGAAWLAPSPAKAGDLEDFQIARAAYEARDYPRAVAYFEALVLVGETPRLTSTVLILESRKYLAAAYVFVGRREAAAAQLELLLRADPEYQLDAESFPVEVVELFGYVRDRIAEEVRREEARVLEEQRHAYEEARIAALVEFAQEEVVIELERSRWVALLPFGIGQFDRGDDGLGTFFLASESIFFVAAAVSLGLNQYALGLAQDLVRGGTVDEDDPRYAELNRLLLGSEITNWVSVSACALLMGAGILEAQLNFRPTRTARHRRTVPPELLEGVEISVGPGTLSLRGSF